MSKSRITRAVREANAAVEESNATGAPLDEVLDMRRERKATHVAASQEVVEAYNDAATRLRDRGAPRTGSRWRSRWMTSSGCVSALRSIVADS